MSLVVASVLWAAGPASAQDRSWGNDLSSTWNELPLTDDYNPDNNSWNGLTTFVALARGLGITVELRRELEWSEIDPGDVLMVLYPTSLIVPRHLSSFIRGGGRVVIGDDFGRSNRLFAELSLLRADAIGVGASKYHNDLAYAPIANAIKGATLAERAPTLVTNHPAMFSDLGFTKAIYRFGPGEVVVSEGELGRGYLVGLADPSVLINRMLQFDDNFQFAINMLRRLTEKGSRKITVVTGRFRLAGEPAEPNDRPDGVAGAADFANNWLGEINEYVATKSTAKGLALLFAGLVAVLLLFIVPLRSKSELNGSWTRARPNMPQALTSAAVVSLFDRTSRKQSFAVAATAVRDAVSRRLADKLGITDPFHGVPEHVLFRQLEDNCGPHASAHLRPVYQALKGLPSRDHAVSKVESRYISQQEFERLSSAVDQLYRSLD